MGKQDRIPEAKGGLSPEEREAYLKDKLRVWYDKKRDCLSTNAPIVAAKMYGVSAQEAADAMLPYVTSELKKAGII